jgi:hypothetical protein
MVRVYPEDHGKNYAAREGREAGSECVTYVQKLK